MTNRIRSFLRDEQAFVACFSLIFLLLVLRNPDALIYPPVTVEDGPYMMAYFFNNPSAASLFRFYQGYISLGPNLLGYLDSSLGIAFVPYALSLFPLLIAALTFSVIALRYFDNTGTSINARLLIGVSAAALPISNFALVSNTTYSLWNMYILLAVLAWLWTPRSKSGFACALPVFFVLIWSHPLSLALAPIILFKMFRSETFAQKLFYFLILMSMASYYAFGINHAVASQHHLSFQVLPDWSRTFLERVVFEPVFTTKVRMLLLRLHLEWIMLCVSAALMILLAVLAVRQNRRGRFNVLSFTAFLYLSVVTSFLSVYTRGAHLEAAWDQRYTYAAAIFLFFSIAFAFLSEYKRTNPDPDSRAHANGKNQAFGWNHFGRYISDHKGLAAGITVWMLAINLASFKYYYTEPSAGERIRDFTSLVGTQSRTATAPWCVRLDRGVWSITFNKWHLSSKRCIDTIG